MSKIEKTPVMLLQELCMKKKFALPEYQFNENTDCNTQQNMFQCQVKVANIVANGIGTSKKLGKQDAAHKALVMLEECGVYERKEDFVEKFEEVAVNKSQQAELRNLCLTHNMSLPIYELKGEVGLPHSKEFTYECQVSGTSTIATSSSKQLAKQLAAQEMLKKIKVIMKPEMQSSLEEPAYSSAMAITKVQKSLNESTMKEEVLRIYNKLYGYIINGFKEYMAVVGITFEDLEEDLHERTEESLGRLLEKLGLEYHFLELQEKPCIVALVITTDTPFTLVEIKMSPEVAKKRLVDTAFDYISLWVRS